MTPHALLFTLAAIGISETVYLIRQRRMQEGPVCVIGSNCRAVLESRYNKIFGTHNDVLGLLFYIIIGAVTAIFVVEVDTFFPRLEIFTQIFIGISVIISLIFTYIQWKVIKAWCFWCLMSAVTTVFMGIIVLTSNLILS
jgi:uncharacterized membrane protein